MKPYYSDYTKHMMRFYAKTAKEENTLHPVGGTFRSDIDKANWKICSSALKKYPDKKISVIMDAYTHNDSMSESIVEVAKIYNMHKEVIWDWISKLEHDLAKRRGLV